MSENEESTILKLCVSVAKLEESVANLNKKVDALDRKIDEGKKRITDKYLYPVISALTAGIVLYYITNFMTRMITTMDIIAQKGLNP